MNITTPCCGASFYIEYGWNGPAYMQERTVEGFECDDCYCDWDATGQQQNICIKHRPTS